MPHVNVFTCSEDTGNEVRIEKLGDSTKFVANSASGPVSVTLNAEDTEILANILNTNVYEEEHEENDYVE